MPIHGTNNSEGSSRDLTEDIKRVVKKRLDLATKHYEEVKNELFNDELNKLKGEEGLSEQERELLYKTLLENKNDMIRLEIELKEIKTVDKDQKGKDEEGSKDSSLGESETKPEESREQEKVEGAVGTEKREEEKKSEENLEPLTKQIMTGLKILEDILNEDENKILQEREAGMSLLMEEESPSEREQFMLEQDRLLLEQERKKREEIERLIEEDDDYFYTTNNYVSLMEKMSMLYRYPREATSKRGRGSEKDKGYHWKGFKERWRREQGASNLRGEEGSRMIAESKQQKEDVTREKRMEGDNLEEHKEGGSREERIEDGNRDEDMETPKLEISDLSSDESMKNHVSYMPDEGRSNYNSDAEKYTDLNDADSEETEDSSEEDYWTPDYGKRVAKKPRVDAVSKETGRIEPINSSSTSESRSKRARNDENMEVIEVEDDKNGNKMGKNGGFSSGKDKVKVDKEGASKVEDALKIDIMQMQETMKILVELGKERLKLITEKNNVELHIEWIKVGLYRGAFGESLQNYFVRTIREMEEGIKMMEERIRDIEIDEGRLRSELKIIYPYGVPLIVDEGQQTVAEVVEVQEVIVI
ncbi:hypothetical protein MACJ_002493 [Theileria orientalis]|uniref:Uncharacterized protein n=1 Tax=Theileria orientalis TaxID=68886 RepID=A0A976QRE5_THEOR|nr:hypothetical protein MACJ_002493 [Theileria orientalis]